MMGLKITHNAKRSYGDQRAAKYFRYTSLWLALALRGKTAARAGHSSACDGREEIKAGLAVCVTSYAQQSIYKQDCASRDSYQRYIGLVIHSLSLWRLLQRLQGCALIISKQYVIRLRRFFYGHRPGVADGDLAPPVRVSSSLQYCAGAMRALLERINYVPSLNRQSYLSYAPYGQL